MEYSKIRKGFLKVHLYKIKEMGKEFLLGITLPCTKVYGKMIKNTEKVYTLVIQA